MGIRMLRCMVLCSVCFIFMCCYSCLGAAEDQSSVAIDPNSDKYESRIEKEYEFLKNQTSQFQSYLVQERTEHREFLEVTYKIVCWAAGVLATLFLGIITFLGWRSRKNIEDSVNMLIERHSQELIEKKNRLIKQDIIELQTVLARETNYKNKSILFIAQDMDHEKINNRELKLLKSRDINNIQLTSNLDAKIDSIKRGIYDVIVYYGNDLTKKEGQVPKGSLETLAELLANRNSQIPLIVYTYEKGWLADELKGKLESYPYGVSANFPMTLVNYLHTVLYYST